MSFLNCKIIKADVTNQKGVPIRIYIVAQLQDTSIAGVREFDYVIDGGTLDEIKDSLKTGIQNLLKQEAKKKHQEWTQEVTEKTEIKSELTPIQIRSQFGTDEIKSLE